MPPPGAGLSPIAWRKTAGGGRRPLGDPVLTADEIRAAAAAHGELGPEYSDAVVASFLERVEEEITVRVDARLAEARQPGASADQGTRRTLLTGIAIGIGIGAFAAVAVGGNPDERMHRLLLVLAALAVIMRGQRRARRRDPVARRSAGAAAWRRRPPPPGPALLSGAQPSFGSTAAASCSICSRWSNSAVNKMSSAPASATLVTSPTQSAAVPVTVAASMAGTRCP